MTRTIDALEKTKIKIEINNPNSLESDPGSPTPVVVLVQCKQIGWTR